MATEPGHAPASNTVDLTGLPEPIVQSIKQLVESLRVGMSVAVEVKPTPSRPPLRGRFADLGLSIPKEHIDEAQREAWSSFLRDPDEQ